MNHDERVEAETKRRQGLNRRQALSENVCPDCKDPFIRCIKPSHNGEIQCRCGFVCSKHEYRDAIAGREYEANTTESEE